MERNCGTFFGVSVGPGDPELLTIKAVRLLEHCPVIAAPQTRSGEMLALDIAQQAADLSGKAIVPLFFPMTRDGEQLRAAHEAAADAVEAHLREGRDVAMVNLGDVSIYATFAYLMDILRSRGYDAQMIPGVPSFCAVAARLGASLTTGDAPLHILPAGADLDAELALSGTKVIMKSGRQIPRVAQALREKHLTGSAAMVCNCGLPGEAVCRDLDALPDSVGYFATIVIRPPQA